MLIVLRLCISNYKIKKGINKKLGSAEKKKYTFIWIAENKKDTIPQHPIIE